MIDEGKIVESGNGKFYPKGRIASEREIKKEPASPPSTFNEMPPLPKECLNLVDPVEIQTVDMTTNFGRSPKSAQSFPEILQEAEKQEVFKLDSARKPPHVCSSEFDPNEYCQYHRVLGHHTEDCLELQSAIQNFIDDCKMTAEARGSSTENSHG